MVVLGAVGYMFYRNVYQTKTLSTANASTVKPSTSASTSTKTPAMTTSNSSQHATNSTNGVFKIPELGIEITVPSSLSTLTYNYSVQSSTADMSTRALAAQASSCTADSSTDSANFNALGSLTKGQGTGQKEPDVTIEKQYSTYYIAYNAPQDTCLPNGSSSSLVNLLGNEQQAFRNSLSTIQPIH